MKIYFLRHGIAEDRGTGQGEDIARPLSEQGKKLMAREAKGIAGLELEIGAIISSPFDRAYETAKIVAGELGMLDDLSRDERLRPGFNMVLLAGLLRDRYGKKPLLLIGHEPDFSLTIGGLIGGGRVQIKKGSLICVDMKDASGSSGELIFLLPAGALAR